MPHKTRLLRENVYNKRKGMWGHVWVFLQKKVKIRSYLWDILGFRLEIWFGLLIPVNGSWETPAWPRCIPLENSLDKLLISELSSCRSSSSLFQRQGKTKYVITYHMNKELPNNFTNWRVQSMKENKRHKPKELGERGFNLNQYRKQLFLLVYWKR